MRIILRGAVQGQQRVAGKEEGFANVFFSDILTAHLGIYSARHI